MGPFPLTAADWIAANVLRQTRTTEDIERARSCACQIGICGRCGMGDHHECSTPRLLDPTDQIGGGRPFGNAAVGLAEGYLCNRAGQVVTYRGAYVYVMLADRTCRWRCPCPQGCAAGTSLRPVQLDLFAAAAGYGA
jgi:hypothetical protein